MRIFFLFAGLFPGKDLTIFTAQPNKDHKEHIYLKGEIALLLLFFASRCIIVKSGIGFAFQTLFSYIQYLDPIWLKEDLLRSFFYLHMQPPLYNLFLGLIFKITGSYYALAFYIIYLLLGIGLMLLMYRIMLWLGINKIVSFIAVSVYMISPSVIIYENWLFYSYPVAFMFVASAYCLVRFFDTHKTLYIFTFFLLLAAITLTRSIYHPVWFLFLIVLVVGVQKNFRKRIIKAAVIPLLLVFSVCLKNYIVFDFFSTANGLLGFQLSRMVLVELPHEEINAAIQKAETSAHAAEEALYSKLSKQWSESGIDVLVQSSKPSLQKPNFNSWNYLIKNSLSVKGAAYLLKNYPGYYLQAIKKSLVLNLFPGPTDIKLDNRITIAKYEDAFYFPFRHLNQLNEGKLYRKHLLNYAYLKELKWDLRSRWTMFLLAAIFCLIVLYPLKYLRVLGMKDLQYYDKFFIFLGVNVLYALIVINLLSNFGHNRYRFSIDAYLLITAAFLVNKAIFMLARKSDSGEGGN